MSRKRKSVTAWAVFNERHGPIRCLVYSTKSGAISAAVRLLYGPWALLKKCGYTVRKVTITEAK